MLYTRYTPPRSFLAFTGFFVILGITLGSTLTPITYTIGSRLFPIRIYQATLRHAARQAVLITLVVIFNLILRALHSWNIFTAIAIIAAAIIFEMLTLARK